MAATRTTNIPTTPCAVSAPTSSRGCSQTHSPRTIGGRKGGGTTTPQPTPTPSRSTRTSAPGGGAPPHMPRHISLRGFNLFGNRRRQSVALEGGDDALHSTATPGPSADDAPPKRSVKKRRGSRSGTAPGASTDDLLARAVLESASRTSASRTSPGVRVRAPPHRISNGELETKQDRCARRKARKKMRHLAAALAEPNTPEFEGSPVPVWKAAAAADLPRTAVGTEQQHWPPADALTHRAAQDDEDAADLDGLANNNDTNPAATRYLQLTRTQQEETCTSPRSYRRHSPEASYVAMPARARARGTKVKGTKREYDAKETPTKKASELRGRGRHPIHTSLQNKRDPHAPFR
ncbi:hypothetical protein B0H13DRAFT_2669539 [Mycena leptocephala]|nr:hypothetical protein B0H13DRAFT_2669539 [Mycena leptocephala]